MVPLRCSGQAIVQAVAKDTDGFAGLTSRSPPTMASFLGGVASGGRGAFVPRSRALTQRSLRHLLKKQKRPQRVKKGTAAVLRDVSLVIGHCFLLIGNRPRPLRFLGLAPSKGRSLFRSHGPAGARGLGGRTTIGANSPAFYGSWNVAKRLIVSLYGTHVVASLSRQASQCACCFHPSLSADRRQAAACGAWLGARAEA